jgi:hypothetical protein
MNRPERFFYYQLAEALGYASVSRLLREVTSQEITEWQAYFTLKENVMEERIAAQKAKQRAIDNNE